MFVGFGAGSVVTVDGDEQGFDQRAVDIADPVRHATQALVGVGYVYKFREGSELAAAPGDTESDFVAGAEFLDGAADLYYVAAVFVAGVHGISAVAAVVGAEVAVHVGAADAAGPHLDQHVIGADDWSLGLFDADVAGAVYDGCFHRSFVAECYARLRQRFVPRYARSQL